MTYKVVYNAQYGGFSLSKKAIKRMAELGQPVCKQYLENNPENYYLDDRLINRHDPILVQVVEELGKEAGGDCATLKVESLYNRAYKIEEFDGKERVIEHSLGDGWVIID